MRVAWSPDLGYATVDPEVARLAEAAARRFADLGCHLEEATPLPDPIWSADQHLTAGRRQPRLGPPPRVPRPGWTLGRDRRDYGHAEPVRRRARPPRAPPGGRHHGPFLPAVRPAADPDDGGPSLRPRSERASLPAEHRLEPVHLSVQPHRRARRHRPLRLDRRRPPGRAPDRRPRFAEGRVLRAAAAFEAADPWTHCRPPIA